MPLLETGYSSATASTVDEDDKLVISQDGVTMSIVISELRKLNSVMTENAQSGTTYTLVAADQTKVVRLTNAGTKTITVPATSGFVIGVPVMVRNAGAGDATLAADTGVTINGASVTIEENTGYALVPRATDVWDIYS
jgi:sulfur transfer complex TusBCD TusB component (DsrH family)